MWAQLAGRVRTVLDRVPNDQYDELLSQCVVFVNFTDVGVSSTVVECIAQGTPLLVNRHPSLIDYLGESYPFFYSDLEQAARKLADKDLIRQTGEYLSRIASGGRHTALRFVENLHAGFVYGRLPDPPTRPSSTATTFST
jgi:hypothetical protein